MPTSLPRWDEVESLPDFSTLTPEQKTTSLLKWRADFEAGQNLSPEEVTTLDEFVTSKSSQYSVPTPEAPKDRPFISASDALSSTWDVLRGIPVSTKAAYYQLRQGLTHPDEWTPEYKQAMAEKDAFDEEIRTKQADLEAKGEATSFGSAAREFAPSSGFSTAAMASAAAGSVPGRMAGGAIGGWLGGAGAVSTGAGAVATPAAVGLGSFLGQQIGGFLGGALASGGAAYTMAGNQFLRDAFSLAEKNAGRSLSREEKDDLYKQLLPIAQNTGMWEAGPEGISNALTFGVGQAVFGLGKNALSKIAKSALGKGSLLAADAALEVAGETATQVGGQGWDQAKMEAVLRGEDPSKVANPYAGVEGVIRGAKEVAPAALYGTGFMLGAGGVIKAGASALGPKKAEPTTVSPEQFALSLVGSEIEARKQLAEASDNRNYGKASEAYQRLQSIRDAAKLMEKGDANAAAEMFNMRIGKPATTPVDPVADTAAQESARVEQVAMDADAAVAAVFNAADNVESVAPATANALRQSANDLAGKGAANVEKAKEAAVEATVTEAMRQQLTPGQPAPQGAASPTEQRLASIMQPSPRGGKAPNPAITDLAAKAARINAGEQPVTPSANEYIQRMTGQTTAVTPAAAATQPTPTPTNAPSQRIVSENRVEERPPVDEGRPTAEAGGRNRPLESGQVQTQVITPAGEVPTASLPGGQPTSGDVGTAPAPKRKAASLSFLDHPTIRKLVSLGRLMSKSKAQKMGGDFWEKNKSLWDDAPTLPPAHQKIYASAGPGLSPDKAAEALGVYVSDMWRMIGEISASSTTQNKQQTKQEQNLRRDEAQRVDFENAAFNEALPEAIQVSSLEVGDVVDVAGQKMRVTQESGEDGNVTAVVLTGGEFGQQKIDPTGTIYSTLPVDESNLAPDDTGFAPPADEEMLLDVPESRRPTVRGETKKPQAENPLAELASAKAAGEAERAQQKMNLETPDAEWQRVRDQLTSPEAIKEWEKFPAAKNDTERDQIRTRVMEMETAPVAEPATAATETAPAPAAAETAPAKPAAKPRPKTSERQARKEKTKSAIDAIRASAVKDLAALRKELGKSATVGGRPDVAAQILIRIGKAAVQEGVVRFEDFVSTMKELVPDLWQQVRDMLASAWRSLRIFYPQIEALPDQAQIDTILSRFDPAAASVTSPEPIVGEAPTASEMDAPLGFGQKKRRSINQLLEEDPIYLFNTLFNEEATKGITNRTKLDEVRNLVRRLPQYRDFQQAQSLSDEDYAGMNEQYADQLDETISNLAGVGIEATLQPNGAITIPRSETTRTYGTLLTKNGFVFNPNTNSFTIRDHGSFVQFGNDVFEADSAGGRVGGRRTFVPRERRDAIAERRDGVASMPDSSRLTANEINNSIDKSARNILIKGGQKAGMLAEVVAEQLTDAALIRNAHARGDGMFMLASDPGTGKTFVMAAAIQSIISKLKASGKKNPKIIFVTQSQTHIDQVKEDIADFGIGDEIDFITYASLDKSDSTNPPRDSDMLVLDEAHNVRYSREGQSPRSAHAEKWMKKSGFVLMASATPYEDLSQMEFLAPTGIFKEFDVPNLYEGKQGFYGFAAVFGGRVVLNTQGKPSGVNWEITGPAALAAQSAAREYLRKRGLFSQRAARLGEGMASFDYSLVEGEAEWVDLYNKMAKVVKEAKNLDSNAIRYVFNMQKRVLEAAKIKAAIEMAEKELNNSRKVAIFVETKSERDYDLLEEIAKAEAFEETGVDQSSDARKAAGVLFDGAIKFFRALVNEGVTTIRFPSAQERFKKAFGDNVAFYTSDESGVTGQDSLGRWESGDVKVLVATIARGGTGLSLHDQKGNDPRTQIVVTLPWRGTEVEQTSKRIARYGMKTPARINWLFTSQIEFERKLSVRVGARMANMGAIVKGVSTDISQRVQSALTDFRVLPTGEILDVENPVETSTAEAINVVIREKRAMLRASVPAKEIRPLTRNDLPAAREALAVLARTLPFINDVVTVDTAENLLKRTDLTNADRAAIRDGNEGFFNSRTGRAFVVVDQITQLDEHGSPAAAIADATVHEVMHRGIESIRTLPKFADLVLYLEPEMRAVVTPQEIDALVTRGYDQYAGWRADRSLEREAREEVYVRKLVTILNREGVEAINRPIVRKFMDWVKMFLNRVLGRLGPKRGTDEYYLYWSKRILEASQHAPEPGNGMMRASQGAAPSPVDLIALKANVETALDAGDEAALRSLIPQEITVVTLEDKVDLDDDGLPSKYFLVAIGSPEQARQMVISDANRDQFVLGETADKVSDNLAKAELHEVLFEEFLPKSAFKDVVVNRTTVQTLQGSVRTDARQSPAERETSERRLDYLEKKNKEALERLGLPTELGSHGQQNWKAVLETIRDDKLTTNLEKVLIEAMLKLDWSGLNFMIRSDGRLRNAGEWIDGSPATISINLRARGRGRISLNGLVLHEMIHHATVRKIVNPSNAQERAVVASLNELLEKIRSYAKQTGNYGRFDYELKTLEEFIAALFPNRPHERAFVAFLDRVPDSFKPEGRVSSFVKSALRRVSELLARLFYTGEFGRSTMLGKAIAQSLALVSGEIPEGPVVTEEASLKDELERASAMLRNMRSDPLTQAYISLAVKSSSAFISLPELHRASGLPFDVFMARVQEDDLNGVAFLEPLERPQDLSEQDKKYLVRMSSGVPAFNVAYPQAMDRLYNSGARQSPIDSGMEPERDAETVRSQILEATPVTQAEQQFAQVFGRKRGEAYYTRSVAESRAAAARFLGLTFDDNGMPKITPETTAKVKEATARILEDTVKTKTDPNAGPGAFILSYLKLAGPNASAAGIALQAELIRYGILLGAKQGDMSVFNSWKGNYNQAILGSFLTLAEAGRALQMRGQYSSEVNRVFDEMKKLLDDATDAGGKKFGMNPGDLDSEVEAAGELKDDALDGNSASGKTINNAKPPADSMDIFRRGLEALTGRAKESMAVLLRKIKLLNEIERRRQEILSRNAASRQSWVDDALSSDDDFADLPTDLGELTKLRDEVMDEIADLADGLTGSLDTPGVDVEGEIPTIETPAAPKGRPKPKPTPPPAPVDEVGTEIDEAEDEGEAAEDESEADAAARRVAVVIKRFLDKEFKATKWTQSLFDRIRDMVVAAANNEQNLNRDTLTANLTAELSGEGISDELVEKLVDLAWATYLAMPEKEAQRLTARLNSVPAVKEAFESDKSGKVRSTVKKFIRTPANARITEDEAIAQLVPVLTSLGVDKKTAPMLALAAHGAAVRERAARMARVYERVLSPGKGNYASIIKAFKDAEGKDISDIGWQTAVVTEFFVKNGLSKDDAELMTRRAYMEGKFPGLFSTAGVRGTQQAEDRMRKSVETLIRSRVAARNRNIQIVKQPDGTYKNIAADQKVRQMNIRALYRQQVLVPMDNFADFEKQAAAFGATTVEAQALFDLANTERRVKELVNKSPTRLSALIEFIKENTAGVTTDPSGAAGTIRNPLIRQQLVRTFLEANGFSPPQVDAAASWVEKNLVDYIVKAKEKALERAVKKQQDYRKSTLASQQETATLAEKHIARMRELIRLGMADPSLRASQALAEEMGFSAFSTADNRKLVRLDEMIQRASAEGRDTDVARALREMFQLFELRRPPKTALEVLAISYNNNALGGLSTMAINVVAPLGSMVNRMLLDLGSATIKRDMSRVELITKSFEEVVNSYIKNLRFSIKSDAYTNAMQQQVLQVTRLNRDFRDGLAAFRDSKQTLWRRLSGAARALSAMTDITRRLLSSSDQAWYVTMQNYFLKSAGYLTLVKNGIAPADAYVMVTRTSTDLTVRMQAEQSMIAAMTQRVQNLVGKDDQTVTNELDKLVNDADPSLDPNNESLRLLDQDIRGTLRALRVPEWNPQRRVKEALRELRIQYLSVPIRMQDLARHRLGREIAEMVSGDQDTQKRVEKELAEFASKESELETGNHRGEESPIADVLNTFSMAVRSVGNGILRKHPILGRVFLGYFGVPLNLLNRGAWLTPYGLLRWHLAKKYAGKKEAFGVKSDVEFYRQSAATDMQLRQRLTEAIVGSSALVVVMLLQTLTGDDDEPLFKVTLAGPANKTERDAWIKQGHHQGSLEMNVGGKRASLSWARGVLEPWKINMIMAGAVDDMRLNRKLGHPLNASSMGEYLGAVMAGWHEQATFLGAKSTVGFIAGKGPDTNMLGSVLYKANPVIPFSGLIGSVERLFIGPDQSRGRMGAIWSNLPVARSLLTRRDVNALGDPRGFPTGDTLATVGNRLYLSGLLPLAVLTPPSGPDKAVYEFIMERGTGPGLPQRGAIEARNGLLTDDQWIDYVTYRGKEVKRVMIRELPRLRRMDDTQLSRAMGQIASDATEKAKSKYRLK